MTAQAVEAAGVGGGLFEVGADGADDRLDVVDGGETTGQVGPQRRSPGVLGDGLFAQAREQPAHLGVGERAATGARLELGGDRVVGVHQAGATNPTDAGGDERHGVSPGVVFGHPLVAQHLERGLGLGIGAIAAKRAVIGRHRQDDMASTRRQPVVAVARRDAGHEAFDGKEHGAHGELGAGAQLVEGRDIADGSERNDEVGRECGLEHAHGGAVGLGHLVEEPPDQRVDIAVGRGVEGHDVELGTRRGVLLVEAAVPGHALAAWRAGGDDDARTASEQVTDDLDGDGTGTCAGHERRPTRESKR